jgi:alpha-ketoglutarate-dependent taurine dioxygenase
MRNDTIEVRPIPSAPGAEIRGIDLSRPSTDEDHGTIRQTLAARGVVFFGAQSLTPIQHLAQAERSGAVNANRLLAHAVPPVGAIRCSRA